MGNKYTSLFKRYTSGLASHKEVNAVNSYFDKMQQGGIKANDVSDTDGERMLKQLHATLSHKKPYLYYKVAACLVLFLALGSGVLLKRHNIAADRYLKAYAKFGEQQQVLLPDSSVVYLNSGSTITYPEKFGETSRNITLTGEAYFEVVHKDKHPFIITSDNFKTQVLGTKFVVTNYQGDAPSVTVVSGKVKVTDKQTSSYSIITKNQRVEYNTQTALLNKADNINALNYIAWRDGRVFFDHADITQVLQTLQRRYNVQLDVDAPYYNCTTISGNFSGDSIQKVLGSISFINGMEYAVTNKNTITIKLKPCNN